MSFENWPHAKSLFVAARERPPAERAAFLDAETDGDDVLRQEVERLLALDATAEGFFESLGAPLRRPMPAAELPVPDRVGPWRVVREVGRGGMGRVFLAERADGAFEQRVAVKVVESAVPGVVERFRRERRILGSLDHPNVARLLDGGALPDGRPYLVMEYVDGVPLTRFVREYGLGLDERLQLFVQVCEVVAYAHRSLVVHRDLKPSNILVTGAARGRHDVKLLDFGIARLLDPDLDESLTGTGQRLHTPAYAAPEQVRGEPVTTTTDVYALGAILYELLTDRRPFEADGEGRWQQEARVLSEPPRPPSQVVRHADGPRASRRLRGDLDRIVLKALRKEPGRRYGSVDALGRDVERHRAGLPVEARRATVGYRLQSFVRRHRLGVAVTAAALSVALTVGTLYSVRVTAERNRAEAAAGRAERVSEFLTDLLANAQDPQVDAVAMLRFLEPAAEQVDVRLGEDPEAQAAVLHTLGSLFERLGARAQADSLLRRALSLRTTLYAPPSREIASTLHELGVVRIPTPDSARVYFEEASEMRRALAQGDDHDLAWSLLQWDRMLPVDHAEKGRRYREALAMLRRLHGPRSAEVAVALHDYHVLGLAATDPGDAFEEALAIYRDLGLTNDRRVVTTMYNLGLYREQQGDLDRAFPLFRQAIQIGRRVFPPGSPLLTTMSTNYGATLHEQGRLVEADSVLATAAETASTHLPESASAIGHSHYWYGRNLADLGRAAEAERALRVAWTSYRGQSDGGRGLHRTQVELARALAMQGAEARARRLLEGLLSEVRGRPYEAQALDRLGQVYRAMGHAEGAAAVDGRIAELR